MARTTTWRSTAVGSVADGQGNRHQPQFWHRRRGRVGTRLLRDLDRPVGARFRLGFGVGLLCRSAPASDGGAAITGYQVAAGPDNATVTVGGTATQATLSGLAHASADVFTVAAVNAAGTSEIGTWAPPAVLSGTVMSPNGQSVQGATVDLMPSDVPASDPAAWSPSISGTATTDANGIWTFTVPPYSSLPSDAKAAADANGGSLNLDATVGAWATVGTSSYNLEADAGMSAYVGTQRQSFWSRAGGDPRKRRSLDDGDASPGGHQFSGP